MSFAQKLARRIKIKRLSCTPGMDEVAIHLNSEPTYEEEREAQIWLKHIEDSGGLVLEGTARDIQNTKPGITLVMTTEGRYIIGTWDKGRGELLDGGAKYKWADIVRMWPLPDQAEVMLKCNCKGAPIPKKRGSHHTEECPMYRASSVYS